jgi:hypothetical protein
MRLLFMLDDMAKARIRSLWRNAKNFRKVGKSAVGNRILGRRNRAKETGHLQGAADTFDEFAALFPKQTPC